MGRMALHLTLGLWLNWYDMCCAYATDMDNKAKEAYLEIGEGVEPAQVGLHGKEEPRLGVLKMYQKLLVAKGDHNGGEEVLNLTRAKRAKKISIEALITEAKTTITNQEAALIEFEGNACSARNASGKLANSGQDWVNARAMVKALVVKSKKILSTAQK